MMGEVEREGRSEVKTVRKSVLPRREDISAEGRLSVQKIRLLVSAVGFPLRTVTCSSGQAHGWSRCSGNEARGQKLSSSGQKGRTVAFSTFCHIKKEGRLALT